MGGRMHWCQLGSVEKAGVATSPPVGPSLRTLDYPAMLCRLQLVRKLEARFDDPPGYETERVGLISGGQRAPRGPVGLASC